MKVKTPYMYQNVNTLLVICMYCDFYRRVIIHGEKNMRWLLYLISLGLNLGYFYPRMGANNDFALSGNSGIRALFSITLHLCAVTSAFVAG